MPRAEPLRAQLRENIEYFGELQEKIMMNPKFRAMHEVRCRIARMSSSGDRGSSPAPPEGEGEEPAMVRHLSHPRAGSFRSSLVQGRPTCLPNGKVGRRRREHSHQGE